MVVVGLSLGAGVPAFLFIFFLELRPKSEFAPERKMRSGKSKLPVVMNIYRC